MTLRSSCCSLAAHYRGGKERVCEGRVVPILISFKVVREWIQALSLGREHERMDLGTVAGYKRVVICQSIRDDAEAILGREASLELMKHVIDGRLMPTSWLNKVRHRVECICCLGCRGRRWTT